MKNILIASLLLVLVPACSVFDNKILTTVTNKPAVNMQKSGSKQQPQGVVSVDIINDNNRLHLLLGKQEHSLKTLWYQHSDDGGVNWSEAVQVLKQHELAIKMMRGGDAQITAQGDTVLVGWAKFDNTMQFNAGVMQTARSIDAGKTWQFSQSPPDWEPGPHRYMDLAADSNAMYAVWLDRRDGVSKVKATQGLRYARSVDGGVSWETNKTLDKMSCSCCWNTLMADGEGNAFVLYRNKQPSDLSIGMINQQQQWQYLNHVGAFSWQFEGCPHIGGDLDVQMFEGKKRLHSVVGTGHPGHLGVHYLYSDDAGKHWSASQQFGNESAIHADVAAHHSGRVVVVWDMMGEDGLAVHVAESDNGGLDWSKARKLSKPGLRATHPKVVKTETGFLVLWTESHGDSIRLGQQVL